MPVLLLMVAQVASQAPQLALLQLLLAVAVGQVCRHFPPTPPWVVSAGQVWAAWTPSTLLVAPLSTLATHPLWVGCGLGVGAPGCPLEGLAPQESAAAWVLWVARLLACMQQQRWARAGTGGTATTMAWEAWALRSCRCCRVQVAVQDILQPWGLGALMSAQLVIWTSSCSCSCS